MEAQAVYIVQFWIRPNGGARVIEWLNDTHLADVVAQPGFLWARMYALEHGSDDGWPAYMMIYGLDSRQALDAYFESDAPKRYARERVELGLDALFRAEHYCGSPERFFKAN